VQGNQVGFESSLQQHLDTEQRRAVLEAIGGSINPDSTLGEIIDAAEALGWSDKMGDLSLADLAEALLASNGESAAGVTVEASEAEVEVDDEGDADADEDDEDEDDEDDDDDDDFVLEVQEPTSRRKPGKVAAAKEAKGVAARKKKAAAASKKAAGKKAPEPVPVRASKKAPEPEPMRGAGKKGSKKLASKPGKKVVEEAVSKPGKKAAGKKAPEPEPVRASSAAGKKNSKKAGRHKPAAVDVDDRMSLDEAAEFFLPVVEDLGEATMQALEEQTGVSRRKLRFHVGQLVKHGYLDRHGMGRGTYYTRR